MSCELCEAQKEVNRQLAQLNDRLYERIRELEESLERDVPELRAA